MNTVCTLCYTIIHKIKYFIQYTDEITFYDSKKKKENKYE